jgi:hypothetical protein
MGRGKTRRIMAYERDCRNEGTEPMNSDDASAQKKYHHNITGKQGKEVAV